MANVTDQELLEILEQIIRRTGAAGPGSAIGGAEVVEPGLVRARVQERGGSSFLMGSDGGVLQYVRPLVWDEDAVAAYKGGKRSKLPAGILQELGFPD